MASFKDRTGRSWEVELTVPDFKPLRAIGVDVNRFLEDERTHFLEVVSDYEKLVGAVFILCKRQAEERGVSEDDFGRSLDADALEQLAEAFFQSFVTFSPARVRPTLRAAKEWSDKMTAEEIERVKFLTPQNVLALLDLADLCRSRKAATDSPELSADLCSPEIESLCAN